MKILLHLILQQEPATALPLEKEPTEKETPEKEPTVNDSMTDDARDWLNIAELQHRAHARLPSAERAKKRPVGFAGEKQTEYYPFEIRRRRS